LGKTLEHLPVDPFEMLADGFEIHSGDIGSVIRFVIIE
jgi:hypothetical protein